MKDVKVVSEIENPLFKRKEVELSLSSSVAPSKSEIDKLLSEKYSSIPDKIRIKKIIGNFGSNKFKITANIYKTKEDMFETERFSKKEKEKIKKAQEVALAPKEEPKIQEQKEAPSEETNE